MTTIADWTGAAEDTWCPGCGNRGILQALREALVASGLEPREVVIVAGIGQAGKLAHYVGCNFLHGLHGRTLVHALGVRLANHSLKVIAVGGDGDIYGEGGSHLLMMFRRNVSMVCLVHNNGVYGLTKGQPSPTSAFGFVTRARPEGTAMPPFNPLAAGLAMNGTFLARGFAGDVAHLARLILEAIRHPGFGFIDILQPCVTYNKVNTYQWYQRRIRDVALDNHNPADREAARRVIMQWPVTDTREPVHIPIGLIYHASRPVYEESFPALRGQPLTFARYDATRVQRLIDSMH